MDVPKSKKKGYRPLGKNATARKPTEELLKEFKEEVKPEDTVTPAPVSRKPAVVPVAPAVTLPKQPAKAPRAPVEKKPFVPLTTTKDLIKRESYFDSYLEAKLDQLQQEEDESDRKFEKRKLKLMDKHITYSERKKANPILQSYNEGQKQIEETGHYKLDEPVFVPLTRKAFYRFIEDRYQSDFASVKHEKELDPEACTKLMQKGKQSVEAFIYQRFVKEYIRQASPYRGVLVYHGLGSGKTCSAIAAAEALYGVSNKKIVVMTPFSLRANFIKEITFCGFRHFNTNNHWIKIKQEDENGNATEGFPKTIDLFARSVLSLSDEYMSRLIKSGDPLWIADFSLPSNFDTFKTSDKDRIRAQINESIQNRITFINYNGISADELKREACKRKEGKPTVFDNAVIVIDEVHNLISLMTGSIEPFLTAREGKRRLIPAEPVTPGDWIPKLCDSATVETILARTSRKVQIDKKTGLPKQQKLNYNRAFLFYRLLTGAKNSKIIALSGTPIINFPEELGVLSNILSGYINSFEVICQSRESGKLEEFKRILSKHPRVDLVQVTLVPSGAKVLVTMFQEGYINVFNADGIFEGVKYDASAQQTLEQIFTDIKGQATIKGIKLGDPTYKSYPRLPPDRETFHKYFVDPATNNIKNRDILKKRLAGIVSYYKGSAEDFMPKVISDEVDKCFMNSYILENYLKARKAEIAQEPAKQEKADPFAMVEVFTKASTVSSYRFRSRAVCNFVFPDVDGLRRPWPDSVKKMQKEAVPLADDIDILERQQEFMDEATRKEMEEQMRIDKEARRRGEEEDAETLANIEEGDEEEEESNEEAEEETNPAPALSKKPSRVPAPAPAPAPSGKKILRIVKPSQKGGENSNDENEEEEENTEESGQRAEEGGQTEEDGQTADGEEENTEESGQTAEEGEGGILNTLSETLSEGAQAVREAVTGATVTETMDYDQLVKYTLTNLYEQRANYLKLDGPTPQQSLAYFSPKLDKIIRRINESEGPTLVYSQYVTVEGLGVLGISLEANEFDQIRVVQDVRNNLFLSKESRASIMKGPGVKRYTIFSGVGSKEARDCALNIFNGNFDALPNEVKKVFEAYDKTVADPTKTYRALGNRHGEICKMIGISSAGAEGISLKCVRQVHIMEPHWHNVRLEQVKGRAVRICSHAELPVEERNVSIYTYVMYFTEEQTSGDLVKRGLEGGVDFSILTKDKGETSDQKIYEIGQRKELINRDLLKIIKESAVDCLLNSADNEPDLACFTIDETDKTKPLYLPDLEQDRVETDAERARVPLTMRELTEDVTREMSKVAPVRQTKVADEVTFDPGDGKGERSFSTKLLDYTTEKYQYFEVTDLLQRRPLGIIYKDPITDSYYM
jgi:hypothetical protein